MIYLEISPRQSGKTSRMLLDIKKYLDNNIDHNIIIFTFNSWQKKYYRDIFKNMFDLTDEELNLYFIRIKIIAFGSKDIADSLISINPIKNKIYFDEVAYFRSLKWSINMTNILNMYNCYFTTSLKNRLYYNNVHNPYDVIIEDDTDFISNLFKFCLNNRSISEININIL